MNLSKEQVKEIVYIAKSGDCKIRLCNDCPLFKDYTNKCFLQELYKKGGISFNYTFTLNIDERAREVLRELL